MSTVPIESLLHHSHLRQNSKIYRGTRSFFIPCSLNLPSHFTSTKLLHSIRTSVGASSKHRRSVAVRASSSDTAVVETAQSDDVIFKENFPVQRIEKAEGKIYVRLKQVKENNWELSVGCSIPGKWILHWGVSYVGDTGSEWDQPPEDMRPPGSIAIKDYAIETPLKKLSEGDSFFEVAINLNLDSSVAALNFVLKDEETGAWYQHKGRDFKVPLVDDVPDNGNLIGAKKGFGAIGQLANIPLEQDKSSGEVQKKSESSSDSTKERKGLQEFYEEMPISKRVADDNSVSVTARKCSETSKNIVSIETDLPGDVTVHWGVCKNGSKKWEIPSEPYPEDTSLFKNKALRTRLQRKDDGSGSFGLFSLDGKLEGLCFVLKLNENTWLNYRGEDFYVPFLTSSSSVVETEATEAAQVSKHSKKTDKEVSASGFTDEIITEIRNLANDIHSHKNQKTNVKEVHENILQEIEKLAAEAYSIFRSTTPSFSEESILEAEAEKPDIKISSGTGSGFEILCQGFNWESNKSGRWYLELQEKADELASLGFTVLWLPPPTESVSPEGYMPKDLYNLNSRYGTIDELKDTVKKFHKVGIKVLGDAVLNHRCAHFKNQNGVWNLFGGRLNWDDRAIVADDPHFQGRGNKSSGDNFHAAPNIDHSQDFVRKDIKEWLCWMMEEVGYDGWRLDFVRGFWGGYVKDYMDASKPYFAVGEYWDSLSYTYGEMDYNQDAHRQRIVDWINATSGATGAFDVTTKGILHTALQKCEYWRLSDPKGKPPGVVGWWPSRAVTFIENHDTGSTQGHWRFPEGKEMQGYAYILTHPGTPAVFFDHIFSDYHPEIAALLSLRNRQKLHCRSEVNIDKCERDVYAAIIDDKVAMKIGPGHYEPPNGSKNWSVAVEGRDYKVWETS
ncbi:Glycosyl hydrolase family 13 catalytic domain [Arabidopsis thaliana x Arabidopsis arenosa]|uniref:alpha-amylase n=1 Tax=Arabidopsis thaliana x Arabidopsis arenosa TaxID=1240361 RepID=A0A8T2BGE0_9BRAS|nr:Glycosyl hydrolase family 13 catalytic domain [Arabidopsis thaliana x Arabidopsis arenosa]